MHNSESLLYRIDFYTSKGTSKNFKIQKNFNAVVVSHMLCRFIKRPMLPDCNNCTKLDFLRNNEISSYDFSLSSFARIIIRTTVAKMQSKCRETMRKDFGCHTMQMCLQKNFIYKLLDTAQLRMGNARYPIVP